MKHSDGSDPLQTLPADPATARGLAVFFGLVSLGALVAFCFSLDFPFLILSLLVGGFAFALYRFLSVARIELYPDKLVYFGSKKTGAYLKGWALEWKEIKAFEVRRRRGGSGRGLLYLCFYYPEADGPKGYWSMDISGSEFREPELFALAAAAKQNAGNAKLDRHAETLAQGGMPDLEALEGLRPFDGPLII